MDFHNRFLIRIIYRDYNKELSEVCLWRSRVFGRGWIIINWIGTCRYGLTHYWWVVIPDWSQPVYRFEENILIIFGEFQADSQIRANGKSTDELILHGLQISENFYFEQKKSSILYLFETRKTLPVSWVRLFHWWLRELIAMNCKLDFLLQKLKPEI